jgi:hypothetical protein
MAKKKAKKKTVKKKKTSKKRSPNYNTDKVSIKGTFNDVLKASTKGK